MRGQVQFLPGQYNLLSWMRERQSQGRWHNVAANPMAYCLPDVWKRMAIVHLRRALSRRRWSQPA